MPPLQFVVTRLSFKTRSATRAAAALRVATSPARLATFIASTAVGMTMARNSSAAKTSASVKAAQFLLAGIANFITGAQRRFGKPAPEPVAVYQFQRLRTVLVHRAVRQKF